ncbi:cytochrome C oxidase subunit IV family protein [Pseudalkalibacillus decolorationis]|uniref:cytochrome C oxidase subunit IV family protein n=1 Tax=Pseudalkalibacillus decolorationis TaxID=163879 RepID=UPI0021487EC5|nr:cytochrome C oxidase subunit IV family protein [Pseudalkalibacillus decolorationis]
MKISTRAQWMGFAAMLFMSGIAFYLVMNKRVISEWTAVVLIGFAIVQVMLQLFFFMDIQTERKGFKWISLSGGLLVAILAIVYLTR